MYNFVLNVFKESANIFQGGGGGVQGHISWKHDSEIQVTQKVHPVGQLFRAKKSKMANKDQHRDLLTLIDRY